MATDQFPSWTWNDHKSFEVALDFFPQDSHNILENISQFLQKPIQEIKYYHNLLIYDLESIESGKDALPNSPEDALPNSPEDAYLSITEANIPKPKEPVRNRGIAWTNEEHELFLIGLKKFGKGDWKSISRECVKTRTSTQIASHAQKYFLRQNLDIRKRKRSSIHDMTLQDNGDNNVTNVVLNGSNLESMDQQQQHIVDQSNLESMDQQQQHNVDLSNLESMDHHQQHIVDQFSPDMFLNDVPYDDSFFL